MYKTTLTENVGNPTCASLFLEFSRKKLLEQYWPRLRGCVESLTDEQVWWRPNEASNSIGNLILHLDGNVRQWLVSSFSGSEDARDRPAEFSARQGISRRALLSQLEGTLREASAVLSRLGEAQLLATFHIQGATVTGLPFTRSWNTSECIMDRFSSSRRSCEASLWVSTANWIGRVGLSESAREF